MFIFGNKTDFYKKKKITRIKDSSTGSYNQNPALLFLFQAKE